jgi:cytochrome oxidase Cu insertion factor (SCO1/SenC/PrrC family)
VKVLIHSVLILSAVTARAEGPTEADFRRAAGVDEAVALSYRGTDCQPLGFEEFAKLMEGGAKLDMERAVDGKSMTVTVRPPPGSSCPSPYPPLAEMPPFELKDLRGRRVISAELRGKPTLMNFYFAQCKPCILEVKPLNEFAKARPDLNILAVTFDEPPEAREFVQRFGFRWRVLPDAREFIDRMRVKSYPMMALFDAQGRLLGTMAGGARDELEAAAVGPRLTRWVDGLLRGR